MKGVVFTEFIEMVEDKFSADIADQIIEEADLPSGGVYTSVGTYDHVEMIALLDCLARSTNKPASDLQRMFGEHLFGRFHAAYPHFFIGIESAFGFLHKVEEYIHVEVRKLYPDAELPKIHIEHQEPRCMHLTYQSSRPFSPLAEGLIRGCVAHFGETVDIDKEDVSHGQGTAVRFTLKQRGAPS